MHPFAPDLDAEVDRVAEAWLSGLVIWRAESAPGLRGVCLSCLRYAEDLALDELPHDVLHLLGAALDGLVATHAATGGDAPLGDLAVAEILRRRAVAGILPRHAEIVGTVDAYVEPQIRRLADRLMEETCGR